MIKIEQIHHVAYRCKDAKETAAFYKEYLNMDLLVCIAEDKVPSNIARYGNTSAGTIPILFDELSREGKVKKGELLCFLALGAGLNWGAALMRL